MRISSCPSAGCGMEIKHICSTREEVERKVAQMHQRAALESSKNKGRKRQRQKQTKKSTQGCTPRRSLRRLSLFDECTCSGGDEDEDEEDDDDDSILSGNFLVDDNEEIGHKADDFAFFARVTREIENREIDRKAEKEEESLDEMVRDLADIMVDAADAEEPSSSVTFFCCNTESVSSDGRSGGLHWMSAVFDVTASAIGGRGGQGAAGSKRKGHLRNIRARKRQEGDEKRQADCNLASSTSDGEGGGLEKEPEPGIDSD